MINFKRIPATVQTLIRQIIAEVDPSTKSDEELASLYGEMAKVLYLRSITPLEIKELTWEGDKFSEWKHDVPGTGMTLNFCSDEESGGEYGLCYHSTGLPPEDLKTAAAFASLFALKDLPGWEIYREHTVIPARVQGEDGEVKETIYVFDGIAIRFPLGVKKPKLPEKLEIELASSKNGYELGLVQQKVLKYYAPWRGKMAKKARELLEQNGLGILFDAE